MPEYKIKRTDRITEKWLMKHQEYVVCSASQITEERALRAKKQIKYDTTEIRFVKFIMK